MKRIAILLIISLLAISDTSVAQAKTYQNCYQLTGDFPYGVAQGYYRVGTSNAIINRKIYTSNKKLDTDYDGIVCEVENLQNPPTTTTTTTTTTTIPITLKTPVADLAAFVNSQGNALTTIKCKSNSSVSTGSGTSIQMTYTGSPAGDNGIRSTLVTNHHVVANCLSGDWLSRQVQVLTGGTQCVGYVWGWSSAKDLASVYTTCDIPKVSVFTGTVVPKPVIGDVGIIIGSAAGVAGTSTQGAIANITDNEIFTTAQAAPGSSGGALFNRSGQLLGIVQAGTGSLTIVIPITKFTDVIYSASALIAWNSTAIISTSTIPSTTATTTPTTTTPTTTTSTIPPTTTTTTSTTVLANFVLTSWNGNVAAVTTARNKPWVEACFFVNNAPWTASLGTGGGQSPVAGTTHCVKNDYQTGSDAYQGTGRIWFQPFSYREKYNCASSAPCNIYAVITDALGRSINTPTVSLVLY